MNAIDSTAVDTEFLAECEVAVCGAGIAGTITALELASSGRDVLLLEHRTALMWELTRARQQATADVIADTSPLLAELVGVLRAKGGLDGDTFHPVVLQLVLDQLARDAGLKTLYQVSPIDLDREHEYARLSVASKARKRTVRAEIVVDTTDYGVLSGLPTGPAAHGELLWQLVLANCTLTHTQVAALQVGMRTIMARVRGGAAAGLALADLAVPASDAAMHAPEVQLAPLLEPVMEALRTQFDGLQRAALVYIADEPYHLTASAELHASVMTGSHGVVRGTDGEPDGIGVWSSASNTADAGLPAWERSRIRNTQQALGGYALAQALLARENRATAT